MAFSQFINECSFTEIILCYLTMSHSNYRAVFVSARFSCTSINITLLSYFTQKNGKLQMLLRYFLKRSAITSTWGG